MRIVFLKLIKKKDNDDHHTSGNYEGLDTVDEFHLLEGLVGADLPSFPLNLFQEYIQSSGRFIIILGLIIILIFLKVRLIKKKKKGKFS